MTLYLNDVINIRVPGPSRPLNLFQVRVINFILNDLLCRYGLGAKSQILSSVAPPGRKSWLLFSVRDMSGGLRNPCFTTFSVVNFL